MDQIAKFMSAVDETLQYINVGYPLHAVHLIKSFLKEEQRHPVDRPLAALDRVTDMLNRWEEGDNKNSFLIRDGVLRMFPRLSARTKASVSSVLKDENVAPYIRALLASAEMAEVARRILKNEKEKRDHLMAEMSIREKSVTEMADDMLQDLERPDTPLPHADSASMDNNNNNSANTLE